MKKGSGALKGGEFEREQLKALSLWWTEGKRDDIFRRSQSSGGRFTTRRKVKQVGPLTIRGKNTAFQGGDAAVSDPEGSLLMEAWSIEYKTGYPKGKTKKEGKVVVSQWCALDVVDSNEKSPTLLEFWNQCSRDAEATGREPILIFRRLRMQTCIVINIPYFLSLSAHFGHPNKGYLMVRAGDSCSLFIMKRDDFFEWVPDIRPYLRRFEK